MSNRVWIAQEDAEVALLEARPRAYVIGWDITRLVARGESGGALGAVVQTAVDHVLRRGVPRLFARCQDEGLDALQPLDFKPIAREYVLKGTGRPPEAAVPLAAGVRYRLPQDAWPLHQLETAVTPPLVRNLEGSTSMDWTERPGKRTEIVVERDGQIVGWVGWSTKPRRGFYQLGMIVHNDHCDMGTVLLTHALGQIGLEAKAMIRIREYQEAPLRACLDAGFEIVSRETLTVKHGVLASAVEGRRLRSARIPTIPVAPLTLSANEWGSTRMEPRAREVHR
jgi:hypothetical protein